MVPTVGFVAEDKWNLASVSSAPLDGDYSVAALFPEYAGSIWRYRTGEGFIRLNDSLTPGTGFWLKSFGDGRIGRSPSTFLFCVEVPVMDKWNIVAGPSCIVPTASVVVSGATTVTSLFFGYGSGGYYAASHLYPGEGYWVKMSGAGTLTMCCEDLPGATPAGAAPHPATVVSGVIERANRITFRDAAGRSQTLYLAVAGDARGNPAEAEMFELPPPPPGGVFDVRFVSGRMLERIDAVEGVPPARTIPIAVHGATYPLVVDWDVSHPPGGAIRLLPGGDETAGSPGQPMVGTGSAVIEALPSGLLAIRIDQPSGVPSEYALGRNFPNPFNPATILPFTVERPGRVVIQIFDVLGRSVRTLVDEFREPGRYSVEWDGRDDPGIPAPSGVYLVRLTAGSFTASGKILLMK